MKYQLPLALFAAFGFASCQLANAEFVKSDISSDQEDSLFSKISATNNLRSQTYKDTTNPSLAYAPETSSTITTIDGVDVNTTAASIDGVEVTNTVSSVDGVPLSTTVVSLDGVPVSSTVVSNPKLGATKGSNLRSGGFIIPFDEQSLQKKSLKKKKKTMSSDATQADIVALQVDVAILNKEVTKLEGDIKFLNATKADKTNPQPGVPAPQPQPVPIAQPQPAPAPQPQPAPIVQPQPVPAPQPQPVPIAQPQPAPTPPVCKQLLESCTLGSNECCSGFVCNTVLQICLNNAPVPVPAPQPQPVPIAQPQPVPAPPTCKKFGEQCTPLSLNECCSLLLCTGLIPGLATCIGIPTAESNATATTP